MSWVADIDVPKVTTINRVSFVRPLDENARPTSGAWTTLPWPSEMAAKELLLASSLGWAVIAWAEGRTDEPGLADYLTGRLWRFTPGQKRFLILWYAVRPDGRWLYRCGVRRAAKGTGKDPLGAAWCLVELLGPARFDGWDDDGRPVGARHLLPQVQIAANSEAQAKDVLRVANAMLSREASEHYGIDRARPGPTSRTAAGWSC